MLSVAPALASAGTVSERGEAFLVIFGVGVLAIGGMIVCLLAIAIEARSVPNRPLHMRMNPLNILVDQKRWTPEIRRLQGWAVRLGLVSVAAVILMLALGGLGFLE
jgi:hypothetical protein